LQTGCVKKGILSSPGDLLLSDEEHPGGEDQELSERDCSVVFFFEGDFFCGSPVSCTFIAVFKYIVEGFVIFPVDTKEVINYAMVHKN
jgi:hypothetical protein